jgi:hypothetical protein
LDTATSSSAQTCLYHTVLLDTDRVAQKHF